MTTSRFESTSDDSIIRFIEHFWATYQVKTNMISKFLSFRSSLYKLNFNKLDSSILSKYRKIKNKDSLINLQSNQVMDEIVLASSRDTLINFIKTYMDNVIDQQNKAIIQYILENIDIDNRLNDQLFIKFLSNLQRYDDYFMRNHPNILIGDKIQIPEFVISEEQVNKQEMSFNGPIISCIGKIYRTELLPPKVVLFLPKPKDLGGFADRFLVTKSRSTKMFSFATQSIFFLSDNANILAFEIRD
jgi:uncharacterized radical SAM superfamily Fe-S cluster-containing enzyme